MIDINILREHPDEVRRAIKNRNRNVADVDELIALDEKWREIVLRLETARAELNKLSKERDIENAKVVKTKVKEAEEELKGVEAKRDGMLIRMPNIPAADVPVGKGEEDNVVVRSVGEPRKDTVLDYMALAEELDLVDVVRAGKVAGSRFGYLKNEAVLLEFALVRMVIDMAIKEGFKPVVPPVMVKPEMLVGMGKTKFIDDKDAFYVGEDNLYLAGSSEQTIGPMHADETFGDADLPRRYVGFSTCFRRESGSYGKDTKGILRVHQFDKVELFSFTKPEDSVKEHELLVSLQEKLMDKLEIPYRVIQICTGDMGFPDQKQIDLEAWIPSENRYRETHSASNTGDFQARGLGIKYKSITNSKLPITKYVHTLNATGVAIGRMLIAIFENHQQSDGSIKIPTALAKYAGFDKIG